MEKVRCEWAGDSQIYIDYHDNEWGRPVHDDRQLFEMLTLEGAQAGLSWLTVLKKRESYRAAFDKFDYNLVALYDDNKVTELLANEGIIRNRLKINSTIGNAKKFIEIINEYGSFDKYIWAYVDNTPIIGKLATIKEVPASTTISDRISYDLKKRGFKFVGSTIIYAFMQAIGMVNDHIDGCFVRKNGSYFEKLIDGKMKL